MKCAWHMCANETVSRKNGRPMKYCSKQCKNKCAVSTRRQTLKRMSVEYKGGKCCKCGYNRCVASLDFHHIIGKKEFGLSSGGFTRSWVAIKRELDKCILVCRNCHGELHYGTELDQAAGIGPATTSLTD